MKVVVTGRRGVDEVADAVVDEVADAVVEEVDAVVEEVDAAGPAGRPGRPMPMPLLFQCTRQAGLPNHRIGPSSLLLCGGGIVQTTQKTISFRMQN
jgi:hypothetical protein